MKRSLQTGVAYHGNRMPSHVRADMREIAKADMDIVVHMLSHTDWERHKTVMHDIFAITEDAGMEVWVDNWGLGGSPGDKSHFLAYYPDSHTYYSNGEMNPSQACLNSPDFRNFTKRWLDTVKEIGGKTIFWDEPAIPTKKLEDGTRVYGCCCPRCKRIFEERYNRPMPLFSDADVENFRTDTIVDYFREVTEYAAGLGLTNTVCVMLGEHHGINLDSLDRICGLETLSNIGSDPYWYSQKTPVVPYEFVYNATKKNLDIAERHGKDHNIWIQAYNAPSGREDEIITATEAAYDAGARTILAWGFRGCESNNYRSSNPERSWMCTVEGMKRIKSMERDRLLAENRKKYMK